jgi:hypothetical protein
MDRNHAILGLSQTTTPLLLDPRRLISFLRVTGLIEDPDRMGATVVCHDTSLELLAQEVFVPLELRHKLLQGAGSNTRCFRYRFQAFLRQVRKLPVDNGM